MFCCRRLGCCGLSGLDSPMSTSTEARPAATMSRLMPMLFRSGICRRHCCQASTRPVRASSAPGTLLAYCSIAASKSPDSNASRNTGSSPAHPAASMAVLTALGPMMLLISFSPILPERAFVMPRAMRAASDPLAWPDNSMPSILSANLPSTLSEAPANKPCSAAALRSSRLVTPSRL